MASTIAVTLLDGGGHTLAATNNNPGTFAYIGVFSSGPQTSDETFQKQLEAVKAGALDYLTRLRMRERQTLDTLVGAGVARSRSDALAWCVRLVRDHEGEWIDQLRDALVLLEKAGAAYERALKIEPNNPMVRQNFELFKEIHDRTNQSQNP